MKPSVIDHRGSPICVSPLERHTFDGSDFLCDTCHKPRAMHVDDGFRAIYTEPTESFPMKPGWTGRTIAGKLLTDKKIDKYAEQGWYSQAFKEARRARMNKRQGNFLTNEGRLIYSPR